MPCDYVRVTIKLIIYALLYDEHDTFNQYDEDTLRGIKNMILRNDHQNISVVSYWDGHLSRSDFPLSNG